MNKDELLKIYSAYLPYGLQISTDDEGEDWVETVIGVNNEALETSVGNYWDFTVKPILYDLSYLTKEIEHEGETFVPIVKLEQIFGIGFKKFNNTVGFSYFFKGLSNGVLFDKIEGFRNKLLEWHFNIFSLPESEYINKATLTQKQ